MVIEADYNAHGIITLYIYYLETSLKRLLTAQEDIDVLEMN